MRDCESHDRWVEGTREQGTEAFLFPLGMLGSVAAAGLHPAPLFSLAQMRLESCLSASHWKVMSRCWEEEGSSFHADREYREVTFSPGGQA